MSEQETLLEFPCQFPIKAMGKAEDDFDLHVVEIVRRHVPDLCESAVMVRDSKGGRFLSVTVTVTATSKAQLDAIYIELSASDRVLMAL
jgi:hypothetical protein